MCRCFVFIALLGCFEFGESVGLASEPARDDAAVTRVVAATLEATRHADWKQYAKFMHPEALREVKDALGLALRTTGNDSAEAQQVLRLFGDAKDVDALLAMSPEDFFVSFLSGTTATVPRLKKMLGSVDAQVVGVVYEKGNLAHVVVRAKVKYQDLELTKMDVISLKRNGEDWRLLLSGDLRGFVEIARRSLKGM